MYTVKHENYRYYIITPDGTPLLDYRDGQPVEYKVLGDAEKAAHRLNNPPDPNRHKAGVLPTE